MAGEIVWRLEKVSQLPVRGSETPDSIEKISEKLDECHEIISKYKSRTNITGETNEAIVEWLTRCQNKVEEYSSTARTYSKAYAQAQVVIGQAAQEGASVLAEFQRGGRKRIEDLMQMDAQASSILSRMNSSLASVTRTLEKPGRRAGDTTVSGGSRSDGTSTRSGSGFDYSGYGDGYSTNSQSSGRNSYGRSQSAGIPLISGAETRHGLGSWMSNMRGESAASIGDSNSGATGFESGTHANGPLAATSDSGAIRPDGPMRGYLPEGTRPQGIGAFLDQGIAAEGSRLGVGGSTAVMAGGLLGAGAATLAARAGGSGLSGLSLAGPNAAAAFSRGVPASGIVSTSAAGGAESGAAGMAARSATAFGTQSAGGGANSSAAAAAAGRGGMARGMMPPMAGAGAGYADGERKSALVGYDVFRLDDDAGSEPYESELSGAGSAEDLHASEGEIEDRW